MGEFNREWKQSRRSSTKCRNQLQYHRNKCMPCWNSMSKIKLCLFALSNNATLKSSRICSRLLASSLRNMKNSLKNYSRRGTDSMLSRRIFRMQLQVAKSRNSRKEIFSHCFSISCRSSQAHSIQHNYKSGYSLLVLSSSC